MLAALPFFGYLATYVRELGFTSYFGMPADLIELSFGEVVSFSFALLIGVLVVVFSGDFLFAAIGRPESPMRVVTLILFAPLGIAILSLYLFQLSIEHWLYWVVPLAVFVAVLVYAVLAPRMKHGLVQGAAKPPEEQPPELRAHTVLDELVARFGVSVLVLLVYLIALLYASWAIGRAEAANRTEWLVSADRPGRVVLRKYGDTIIAATVNRKSHTIRSPLAIWKVSSTPSSFRLTHLGHLHR